MAVLRTLAVVALMNVPVPAAPPAPQPLPDAHAACLKTCAGAPKEASGKHLLQCLAQCQPAPVHADAGAP